MKTVCKFLTFVLVIVCLVLVSPIVSLWAQTSARYAGLSQDVFLKQWLVLGPISLVGAQSAEPAEEAQRKAFAGDSLLACGGEATVRPEIGSRCVLADGERRWELLDSSEELVDLAKRLGQKEHSVAYAYAEVEAAGATTILVGVGSDDGVKVWLNGKLVHENWILRDVQKDQDIALLNLQQGTNRLLVKIQNAKGDWGFACRALGPRMLEEKLWTAARSGDLEKLELILTYGKDIEIDSKPRYGLSPWQVAHLYGRTETADFLASKGADVKFTLPAPETLLDNIFTELTKGQTPGAAVLVARNGQFLFKKGYGYASLEHRVPITSETKFRIGSITKQFTAAAILRLQEQGKLSVSDPLSKFTPDFPKGNEVTIHQLLTHTSGIHSYTSKPDFLQSVTVPVKPDDLIQSFKNDPYDFAPGAKWAYNNSGYFLLGYIIEKVSGQSYADYLKTQFFEPIGMSNTGVHDSRAILEQEATGYAQEGKTLTKALNWDMSRAGGAGALYSTVEDLYRWNEALFSGKVLSEPSLKAAWTPVKTASQEKSPEEGYGYGWGVVKFRGLLEIQHSGGLHGFTSHLSRYPTENFTVAILANAVPPLPGLFPGELSHDIAQIYLGAKMESRPSLKAISSLSSEVLDRYTGRYDYGGPILTVTREGNRLFAQLTGQPRFEIFPKSETEFFWKIVEAQVRFVQDSQGQVVKAIHRQGGTVIEAARLEETRVAQVNPAALEAYTGKYDYGQGRTMIISREGDRLFAQLSDQPKFEIFPKSDTQFFWRVVNAQITFVKDANGKVTKGIHEQGGQTLEVRKIE